MPVHQFRHTKSLSQLSKLPGKRTLPAANPARWDETGCEVLLTADYQRGFEQFVKSFDCVVIRGVDAANGSLVSEVTQSVQPGGEGLVISRTGGPLPSCLLGQQGQGICIADEPRTRKRPSFSNCAVQLAPRPKSRFKIIGTAAY